MLICRTKSEVHSDQGISQLSRVQISLIQLLERGVLLDLEPGVPPLRQGAESQPHLCGDCLPSTTGKAGDNSWKLFGLVTLKLRGKWAELMAPRTKPVPGMEASLAVPREGD